MGALRELLMVLFAFVANAADEACETSKLPRIAYLISAHDRATLVSAGRLLDVIYDPENFYVLHVDSKYRDVDRSLTDAMALNRANVEVDQIYDVRWARWSMIEPTLWGMGVALKARADWEVFINLSGDSWPVLTPTALRRRLQSIKLLNFVTSAPSCPTGLRPTARSEFGEGWHKKQAYPHPMLKAEPTLEAYYGSQWMILSRPFVEYVVSELERPDSISAQLREWFLNGWIDVEGVGRVRPHIPDETFFPSVLMHSAEFNTTAPPPVQVVEGEAMFASFYIRMDEHYPWSAQNQRYVSLDLDKPERPWGPYYLGAYDLGDVKKMKALFLRKVSVAVDANIFKVLPVSSFADVPDLSWPKHGRLAVSSPSNFRTVSRGSDEGCVRVSESIHCPPNHNLRPDVQDALRAADEL
ncbi:core-2/I-branching enzyme-domain-containing protein [Pelagophyceae sp. CCMP2097]|nr:core-2/I-branching enzyme-domain-containing protein [Pelagophyceae sp. CCMP2097]